jgi:hypothetical protein
MRKLFALVAAVAIAAVAAGTALAGNGTPIDTGSANVLTVAVYGDAPYGTTPTDTAELTATPAFIDSINRDPKVDLVLHVGDIHSGKQYCTQAYDQSIFDLWTQFKDPLVYTPGDNEWADCHKAGEGGNVTDAAGNVDYANGNPIANLALVRSIFFANPGVTLGGRKKQVISQAQSFDPAHPSDAQFVENVMWEQSKTLFVTVNIPGGSNNDIDPWFSQASPNPAQPLEMAQRTAADVRWLNAAFQEGRGRQRAQRRHRRPVRHVGHERRAEPSDELRADHRRDRLRRADVRQARSLLERRLARLPLRQPAATRLNLLRGVRRLHDRRLEPAPVLRRAELPPHRRPRLEVPARMAEADYRSPGGVGEPFHADLVGPVPLAARDAALTSEGRGPFTAGGRRHLCRRPRTERRVGRDLA